MRYVKLFELFESTIYGQQNNFSNNNILYDIKDLLLELEDEGLICRIWVNNHRGKIIKTSSKISFIEIEINNIKDSNGLSADSYKVSIIYNEFLQRLKKYLNINDFKMVKFKHNQNYGNTEQNASYNEDYISIEIESK